MQRANAVKALDQLQNCLLRAEKAKKDIDLIVAMRVAYMLLEDWVKRKKEDDHDDNDGAKVQGMP